MALQRRCSTLVSELEGSSALHDPHSGTISVMDQLDEASTRLSALQVSSGLKIGGLPPYVSSHCVRRQVAAA